MTKTCGTLLLELLHAYGVNTVFGIPGVHTIELYRGMKESPIRHVTPRHEQGAGFMADGYARATGEIGVCICISGPGMTNIATAMGQAYADSIPMLVISGVVASDNLGREGGYLHEMKGQREMLNGVTGFSHTLLDAAKLLEVLARAFASLQAERPRPVHIEIPVDVMAQEVAFEMPDKITPLNRPGPDLQTVAQLAEAISISDDLLILAGGGCVDAGSELLELADLIGAPTALTVNARGLLPADHPLLLSGVQSSKAFHDAVASADTILAIGTELGETDYDFYGLGPLEISGKLLRIDLDPKQLSSHGQPVISLVSDAGSAMRALVDTLINQGVEKPLRIDGAAATAKLNAAARTELSDDGIRPRQLIETITEVLPDAIIVGDSTQPIYHANFTHRPNGSRRWFNSVTGFGTLGYALPAAIGAQLGKPDSKVVAVAGDGGFQFTLNELIVAVEEKLPLIVTVWNNGGYGEIKDYMLGANVIPTAVDVRGPDLEKLAAAYGLAYARCSSMLMYRDALSKAAMASGPYLIEYVESEE